MPEHLFVCGTLLPGRAPKEIEGTVRRLSPVGRACVLGRLYDLGEYPGAVLDASSPTKIQGFVFSLPDDPVVLQALDAYEGFEPGDALGSLFVRQETTVMLADGRTVSCWMYAYNRDPVGAPLIPEGDYEKFQTA